MKIFEAYKSQVVETAQQLTRKGYLMATGGNISVRMLGQKSFAITPSNYDYMKMTPQEADVPDIFKVLDQIAARVPAGANGLIYTPWLWGERAPVEERALRAGLYNLSLNNTREDIIRAFLEGIAFNTRWLLGPVEKFLGRKVDSLNIVGGGAQSDVWCQIFADVMDVEINQVADPIYANARGAAWIAAVGLGEIAFGDVPELVQFKRRYQPIPAHRAIYDNHFGNFVDIYRRMKNLYRRMN